MLMGYLHMYTIRQMLGGENCVVRQIIGFILSVKIVLSYTFKYLLLPFDNMYTPMYRCRYRISQESRTSVHMKLVRVRNYFLNIFFGHGQHLKNCP
jgi:hypothetical protein